MEKSINCDTYYPVLKVSKFTVHDVQYTVYTVHVQCIRYCIIRVLRYNLYRCNSIHNVSDLATKYATFFLVFCFVHGCSEWYSFVEFFFIS